MSKNEEASLAFFGKEFQEKLVQLILDDSQFGDQIEEVLDTNFFELKYLQVFTEIIYQYKNTYGTFPTRTTLEAMLRTELEKHNPVLQKQVRDFFAKLLSGSIEDVDDEYVKVRSLDFCKKQKLKQAMIKSVTLMEKSSFDEISKIINNALKLGLDNDHGYDFIKHFEERYKPRARDPVSTGWEIFDGLVQGGHGKGELGVVIASTGAGKSMMLVHLGAQAMLEGKNVVYYTLELSDVVIGRRFDSCLTKIPLLSLNSLKDEVLEKVRDVPGKLIIKEYPTKSVSPDSLRNHLRKLQQKDFKPDMIIVDYGDLLKPVSAQKEKRTELETIYEELRGIAGEFQCPLWTASQTNRCFGENTTLFVQNENGECFKKNISEVKVGDRVKSLFSFKQVIDTNTSYQKLYRISLADGKWIEVSDKHMFPVKNHCDATQGDLKSISTGLKEGHVLLVSKDCVRNESYEFSKIVSIKELDEQKTYDITLEDQHFLFANEIYTHNSGLNAEIVTLESISEAFNKCFVADLIFSLSRTPADRAANTGRIFIAKNRNGPDGIVLPVFMDTKNIDIKVLEPSAEQEEELKRNATKSQAEKLKQKYKRHREDKKLELISGGTQNGVIE